MNSALLKLQIGPVQDFIAQARSTRDLWSGSYLLSWLVASGLNCLMQKGAEETHADQWLADCVIFPQLKAQPLMHNFQSGLFPPPATNEDRHDEMLTPNLTNLFLAQLPLDVGRTTELARAVEQAIRDEWKAIAERCWRFGGDLLKESDKDRFNRQVAGLLHIAWQVTPLVGEGDACRVLKGLPMSKAARDKLAAASGVDLCFPATLALNSWQLDAVRQVREFSGARDANTEPGKRNEKDSLTGREEQIVGARDWWDDAVKGKSVTDFRGDGQFKRFEAVSWEMLFRERHASEYFGAITFIKRVWHLAVLEQEHDLESGHRAASRGKQFPFPSTLHIASHDPAKNEDDPREPLPDEAEESQRYFAVLTMDGDEMGRWMSGEKFSGLVDSGRLQNFSRRLSIFGLKCARPIVEACDGRLIYSGGDDVVALLPADTALQCAKFLRDAFKGQDSFIEMLKTLAIRLLDVHRRKASAQDKVMGDKARQYYVSKHLQHAAAGTLFGKGAQPGELILHPQGEAEILQLPADADVSAGIAVAHFKSPLQDAVREAQAAERRAKKQLGRSAVAITLMKRSGEITEWGCRWDGGGLEIYDAMLDAVIDEAVSNRLPHRIVGLLDAYLTESTPLAAKGLEPVTDFPVTEILLCEFRHALGRHARRKDQASFKRLANLAPEAKNGKLKGVVADYLSRVRQLVAVSGARRLGAQLAVRARNESAATRQELANLAASLETFAERAMTSDTKLDEELGRLLTKLEATDGLPADTSEWLKKQTKTARKKLARELNEAPVAALIGLCQTVAFAAGNESEFDPPIQKSQPDSQINAAERQPA
jgi:CRISPR-associated protein Cmr2